MNNLSPVKSKYLLSLLALLSCILSLSAAEIDPIEKEEFLKDQEKLKATKLFYTSEGELNYPLGDFAVMEFRIYPTLQTTEIYSEAPSEPSDEVLLYLGIWNKDFTTYDNVRAFLQPSRFYFENKDKNSAGRSTFKMDLHAPTNVQDRKDTWTMIVNSQPDNGQTVHFLAERPVPPPTFRLSPIPFREIQQFSLNQCSVSMLAANPNNQKFHLTITNDRNTNKIAQVLQEDTPNGAFWFYLESQRTAYTLTVKEYIEGKDEIINPSQEPPVGVKKYTRTFSLKDSGWLPAAILHTPLDGTLQWQLSAPFCMDFRNGIPVQTNSYSQGQVCWIFLNKAPQAELTLTYDYLTGTAPLSVDALPAGWHFIATEAYGLKTKNDIQTLIQTKTIHPKVKYFNFASQKYENWTGDSLPDSLFIYRQ